MRADEALPPRKRERADTECSSSSNLAEQVCPSCLGCSNRTRREKDDDIETGANGYLGDGHWRAIYSLKTWFGSNGRCEIDPYCQFHLKVREHIFGEESGS